jgi:glyoxylase-like metal-dependent hydrolase (beta-lactamase superfamily II)
LEAAEFGVLSGSPPPEKGRRYMESYVEKQGDGATTTNGTARNGGRLRQLSEHLFVFDDTCNVYMVKAGEAGLLIDAGSGAVARHAADAGVTSLEWVLHTHHHRDQCWGTPRIVAEYGAQVGVPEHERYLFESARDHWRTKRVFDNYNDRNTFFAPGEDIPVDAVLEDYEEFQWRGITFFVLPAKGHTLGSSALLADIDGHMVAFTGDLLTAGGHLYQLHAMEYGYGEMAGVLFTLQSLQALRRRQPELILPSHGAAIEAAGEDINRLEKRLIEIARLGGLESTGLGPKQLPEPELIRLSEHLIWSGPWTCSNFYVLLSGTGEALFIDYGYPTFTNMRIGADTEAFETTRFVAHHLEELEERFGISSIEVVIPTHIHDDHTCGIPYLQRYKGAACWALDEVAKVLESPAEWASTPCTYPKPIRIDRKLAAGEKITWRGFELTFHHAPGQTEFHSVVSTEIDGKVVAFTGDNWFLHEVEIAGKTERRPFEPTVFRNSFQLAMHRHCVEVMREISPELLCPGHGEVLSCYKEALDHYADFVALKEQSYRAIVAEPADHYIDLFWARLRPYLATVPPASTLEYTLMLRNNLDQRATYTARLLPPPGWTTSTDLQTLELDPGERGEISLPITAPSESEEGRALVTAEIFINERSQGPLTEALISLDRRGEGSVRPPV